MDKLIANRATVALNIWKSFMILYHRAANSSKPEDWFDACRNAKSLEFYLRKQCSFWNCIKFIWLLRKEKDETYR